MSRYSDTEQRIRYMVRNEAEQSIKDLNIDRANFHEVPKTEWERVIKRFYYTFMDYEYDPKIQLGYVWLKFREELHYAERIRYGVDITDWEKFVGKLDELIPKENRPAEYYYINDSGWVYEGKLPEIIRVLGDCSGLVEDFYILPKRGRFDWVVCYCGDGDCKSIIKRTL